MEKGKYQSPEAILLRKKAEEQLEIKGRLKATTVNDGLGSSQNVPDTLKLLHELEVLHIELEMQNEELQLAKEKAEHAARKYENLYNEICDFSPAGYFRLDRDGIIFSLNKSAAALLCKEPTGIENKNFRDFVSPESLPVFNHFFQKIFETGSKQTCKLSLILPDKPNNFIHLEGIFSNQEHRFLIAAVDITEHRKAEEFLKAGNEKFRQLIANSFDMLVLIDSNGIQQFVSESCEKILGYQPHELINIPVIENMIHPDDREKIVEIFKSAINNGSGGAQYRHRHKSGGWVYLEAFGTNQLNNPGINSLVLNVRDITDRKFAEEALHESAEKHRILLDESSDPIFTFYPDGRYRYVNKAFADGVGRKLDEIIGKKIWDVFSKEEADKRFAAVKWVFENRQEKVLEVRVPRPDGDRWYLTTVKPNMNEGEVVTVICISKDITVRKQAEFALRESNELNESLLKTIPFGMDIVDEQGRILFMNGNLEKLFGNKTNSHKCWDLYCDKKSQCANCPLLSGINIGKTDFFETKDIFGGKTFQISHTGMIFQGKKAILEIFQDITDRKQAVEALLESEARLRELNATKDKFFSIIAHDLRNPFNSIIGYSNLLARQITENNYEGISKYGMIIQNSSQRAMDLLMNLLEWSSLHTGRMAFVPECIDMVELTNEALKILNSSAQQKSIAVKTEFPPLAFAMADKEMISTVLRNLISNAVKFTHTGGEIVISVKPKQKEWVITVSDNGVGINKEAIGKLFRIDKNHSTLGTEDEKGTGLGLLLCKEFVEKNIGKIWIESEEKKGSKFHFSVLKAL